MQLLNKVYKAPNGTVFMVDGALNTIVLDRLNSLPGIKVDEVCAGHRVGIGDRTAHLVFRAPTSSVKYGLDLFRPYLRRLSVTEYQAWVSYYNRAWRLEVRRDEIGQAPQSWWHKLVDLLEENPNCEEWMVCSR